MLKVPNLQEMYPSYSVLFRLMLSNAPLFYHIDDFCPWFEPQQHQQQLENGLQRHRSNSSLCLSENMAIVIAFHQPTYRNFKWFYTQMVYRYWWKAFPDLVSHNRLIEWMPSVLISLRAQLRHSFGRYTRISFIDTTSIKVCHNRRIASHKVFQLFTARGKTSVVLPSVGQSPVIFGLQVASGHP